MMSEGDRNDTLTITEWNFFVKNTKVIDGKWYNITFTLET